MTDMLEKRSRYPAPVLQEFVRLVLLHFGLTPEDAAAGAEVLVDADLQGIESHGIAHLPWHYGYVPGLREGIVNPRPRIAVLRESPVAATWDADAGFGPVVARRAMEACIAKAREAGIGMVTVRNGRHFGAAGYYARMAANEDMVGMAMCNVRPMAVAAGGLDRVLGTNPIAFAVPVEGERPFLLDMATTAVSSGKLEIAARQGKPIPAGWAVDGEGRPASDPLILQKGGALLPLGSELLTSSYKGYGLGLMVDILTGLLPGAGSALFSKRHRHGYWFAAWRIDAFTDPGEFRVGMRQMLARIRDSRPAEGVEAVLVPGDPEWKARAERERDGIPLEPETVRQLTELGEEIGRPFPEPLGS